MINIDKLSSTPLRDKVEVIYCKVRNLKGIQLNHRRVSRKGAIMALAFSTVISITLVDSYRARVSNMQRIESLVNENTYLQESYDNTLSELNGVQLELDSTSGELERFQAMIDGKNETIDSLKGKVIELEKKNSELSNALSSRPTPVNTPSRGSVYNRVGTIVSSKGPSRNLGTFEATAYTDCPSENGGYTTTALGTELRPGVVAVDRSVIPLGTELYVTFSDGSVMEAVAEDVGGAIRGNRIDILFPDKTASRKFGRRNVTVSVKE